MLDFSGENRRTYRYVQIQVKGAERKTPNLINSLDSLFSSQNTGKRLAEIGAGMGHLAYEMHRRGYEVLVEEPFAQSVGMLRDREPAFYDYLRTNGLLFEQGLIEFARDTTERKLSGVYDAVYSNGGPLLVMKSDDGKFYVESYVDQRTEASQILHKQSLNLVLESLRGLRTGIRKGGLLLLSIESIPNLNQRVGEYNGSQVEYAITSDYATEPNTVIRTRTLKGGKLPDIVDKQKKLAMTLEEFTGIAQRAGFAQSEFSNDGQWLGLK